MKARRWWAWPLVPVYAAGLAVRDWLRRVGWLRVRRLEWPVVSVGSLSAGGAGKTPVVIALAELLRAKGWAVDVLSRGYGRAGSGVERVDLAVEDAAGRFGDEPVLIARKARVPVWVGAERYVAGLAAEGVGAKEDPGLKPQKVEGTVQWAEAPCSFRKTEAVEGAGVGEGEADSSALLRNDKQEKLGNDREGLLGDDKQEKEREQRQEQLQRQNTGILRFAQNDKSNDNQNDKSKIGEAGRRVHLLDDGFQHWGLERAVDVVLVTEEDLQDALLPAGNRRERLAALGRADVVVLREEERGRVEATVRRWMREGGEIWSIQRELRFIDSFRELGGSVKLLGFCAIARPGGFWSMLEESGFVLAGMADFGDHHAYTLDDIKDIATKARACGAMGFATTEKDAVKLNGVMMERLREVGPVCVAGLEARFVDEADVMRGLEARCQ